MRLLMKVLIVSPSFSRPHGGLRMIAEWANRLTEWHDVSLHTLQRENAHNNGWVHISGKVKQDMTLANPEQYDLLIMTSPATVKYDSLPIKKKVIFMQMAEHLFRPSQPDWQKACNRMYLNQAPIISISKWNMEYLKQIGRTRKTFYVGNGVNFKDFPIVPYEKAKKEKAVLVEGWESGNASKDPKHISHEVAERLKADGYRILAFSGLPISHGIGIPDEYYKCPDLRTMNKLYERAQILIKATMFDARSCAPVEAMTKATPTVRAIQKGDDDLIDNINCLRVDYDAEKLYSACKKILTEDSLRERLSRNCIDYVTSECSWDLHMPRINQILTNI